MPGPMVETLLLANHAEALNGLLYIQGGGWVHHWRDRPVDGQPPPTAHFGVAMSILVPWGDTNRRYPLSLEIVPEDGGEPLTRIDASYEVGRPPGTPPGSDQRSVLAVNFDLHFPADGGYRVSAQTGGSTREISLYVHDSQPAGTQAG